MVSLMRYEAAAYPLPPTQARTQAQAECSGGTTKDEDKWSRIFFSGLWIDE